MTTRALVLLVDLRDSDFIPLGDTLVDVRDALTAALMALCLEATSIDVRVIPPPPERSSAFSAFVVRHVTTLPRSEQGGAFAGLTAILHEARAEERRRLCASDEAYADARAITHDEIARHAVPQERSA